MRKKLKVGQFSDLHYSGPNLVEADRCFGFAVEDAISQNIDVGIISGDSTDHRLDAHAPAFIQLVRRIKQLADHCPVFILQGTFSHEPAGMIQLFAMIGAKHPIVVSDRIEMVALSEGKWIEYDPLHPNQPEYDLVITSLPTLNKADLVSQVGAEHASEQMGDYLAAVMQSHASLNTNLRALGVPTVLVSHGTVDGSMNESGVPMAGLDHEFTLGALFSAQTDVVMLGHIHKHQYWERNFNGVYQLIAYPGSIGRFHYGELGEKHYLVWNVASNGSSFEAIVTPSRNMIEIEFTGVPDLVALADKIQACAGAYVRVRYEVDEEFAKTIDRNAIREILAGAAEVKIEGSILTVQRTRCAGISTLPSVQERYLKWCEISSTPTEGLIERIALIQALEPEDIASDFAKRNRRQSDPVVAQSAKIEMHPLMADLLN